MAPTSFRGDPYRALDVSVDASPETIKRRYRELARELHPDRSSDPAERQRRTREMARINGAYDLLRDPERRERYDATNGHRRAASWREAAGTPGAGHGRRFDPRPGERRSTGPPPPRRTRPVTARFDTSATFHGRNTTLHDEPPRYAGQRPISARERAGDAEPLRASRPSGPVERRSGDRSRLPTLDEARETILDFGKFHGRTLGEIEQEEPTYIDWIARTITRDRDLVVRARVIQTDLDERGVRRATRPPSPGFGLSRAAIETDEREAAGT